MRGYFGIGIYNGKTRANIGTLCRSAHAFGASFIFTVLKRYELQASDTTKAARHIPLIHFDSFEELLKYLPKSCQLIGLEISPGASSLYDFAHPLNACYILGAEDNGLPFGVLEYCRVVKIPDLPYCLNVAVAGSIVMYDRQKKMLDKQMVHMR